MRYAAITIDTEPDCAPNWKRSSPLTFTSVTYGIKELLQPLFDRHGIRPVYFISPEILGNKGAVSVLKKISLSGRCEIGSHLHSEYVHPKKEYSDFAGTSSKKYACFSYDDETEYKKLKNFHAMLEKEFSNITSYRAARYGADTATIKSLLRLGYTVDSSVTPGIDWSGQGGPDFSKYPDQPYRISLEDYSREDKSSKILEVPITIRGKRLPFLPDKWYFYRWLRPSHMTVFEQKQLALDFIKSTKENVCMCMMFHSMEVIPNASPYTRTWLGSRLLMSRLGSAISFLKSSGFEFLTLRELGEKY